MKGIAKAFLYSIFITAAVLVFANMVFFFPWYMTIVVETFNLSQIVSTDNYLKESYYQDTLYRIKNRPLFDDHPDAVKIIVTNGDSMSAIGDDDASIYFDQALLEKPYRQRGEIVEVEMQAIYPFTVTLWGTKYEKTLEVSFKMQTTGLKLYKDLDYY